MGMIRVDELGAHRRLQYRGSVVSITTLNPPQKVATKTEKSSFASRTTLLEA